MGCAASSTVNTADDIKPVVDTSVKTTSPKLVLDSREGDLNKILNYGDQLEKNKDIIEETTNFHNSPAVMSPDRQSVVSSSKSISNTIRQTESYQSKKIVSKFHYNVTTSPTNFKSNLVSHDNLSNSSSRMSNKMGDKNDVSEKKITNEYAEKVYRMISPQESVLSSHRSNIIYKPTSPSDDELKVSKSHSLNQNESKDDLNQINKSQSVLSDSKTLPNNPEEFWNEEPKPASNTNSVNHHEFEKSSRNSGFSHTYTGSIHSPFFDSFNHGHVRYDEEENQNHDEVTETINDRVLLGTGDSEHWINANQNFLSDRQNMSSTKTNDQDNETRDGKKSLITNLSATGDKSLEILEQFNDDNTLDIDNNHMQNDAVEEYSDSQILFQKSLHNIPCMSHIHLSRESLHTSTKNDVIKTAEVVDPQYEGMLIGMASSGNNFQIQYQYTMMDPEEAINSMDHDSEF